MEGLDTGVAGEGSWMAGGLAETGAVKHLGRLGTTLGHGSGPQIFEPVALLQVVERVKG
jgi:hypothetical protein